MGNCNRYFACYNTCIWSRDKCTVVSLVERKRNLDGLGSVPIFLFIEYWMFNKWLLFYYLIKLNIVYQPYGSCPLQSQWRPPSCSATPRWWSPAQNSIEILIPNSNPPTLFPSASNRLKICSRFSSVFPSQNRKKSTSIFAAAKVKDDNSS